MEALSIESRDISITIEDIHDDYVLLSSAERQAKYQPVIAIGEDIYEPLTVLQVVAFANGVEAWRVTITCSSGARTIPGEHTSVCLDSTVVFIAGAFVISLGVDDGKVIWKQQCDSVFCYSLHLLPNEKALVIHGELEITKLSFNGRIIWQSSGKDIFSGAFALESKQVVATDWEGNVYSIRLDNGHSEIIGHGKPSYETQ